MCIFCNFKSWLKGREKRKRQRKLSKLFGRALNFHHRASSLLHEESVSEICEFIRRLDKVITEEKQQPDARPI